MNRLTNTPAYREYLGNYRDSWVFADAETAARRLEKIGFVDIKTWLEPAPTVFEDAGKFCEFLATAVLHRHLELLPDPEMCNEFLENLARQSKEDDPPLELDYWRLNIDARKRR